MPGASPKKLHSFREVDKNVRCLVCDKPLKKNLILRKSKPPHLCFMHYIRNVKIKADIKASQNHGTKRW